MADDITVIRLNNMTHLFNQMRSEFAHEPEHGMVRRFSQKTGVSAQYLSQIRNGRKNIGHSTARRIEKAFGREEGWLDSDHSSSPLDSNRREIIRMINGANQAQASAVLALLKTMIGNT